MDLDRNCVRREGMKAAVTHAPIPPVMPDAEQMKVDGTPWSSQPESLLAGAIKILPILTAFDDRFEVFLPDYGILDGSLITVPDRLAARSAERTSHRQMSCQR
jgi:hypothetical protein